MNEFDGNGFLSGTLKGVGYTIFTGYVGQNATDVNKDNFSELPRVRNLSIHPKLFFNFEDSTTLALGLSSAFETRKGGDMYMINHAPNYLHSYFIENLSSRNNLDLNLERKLADGSTFTCKGVIGFLNRSIETSRYFFQGHQMDYYGEISYFLKGVKSDYVFGLTANGQEFRKSRGDNISIGDDSQRTLGLFAQNDLRITDDLLIESGLRFDYSSNDQGFLLPKLSLLYKLNHVCYLRLNAGMGYKLPDIFSFINEESELDWFRQLKIAPERAENINLDANYTFLYDKVTSLTLDQTFFYTRLNNPVAEYNNSFNVFLVNENMPVESYGAQTYTRLTIDEYEIYLSYVYTHIRKKYDANNPSFLATPQHTLAAMFMFDLEGGWRWGLDISYYGHQLIEYSETTPAYVFMASMIAKQIGDFTIVVNCENLFDYRQRDFMTLAKDGKTPVYKTLWAPIEGRVFNLAIKYKL